MADEEEEDYMGISLSLSRRKSPSLTKKNSGGKIMASNSSDKKPRAQNWQEERKLKRERKLIEEDMQKMENLGAAIPQSNIGFKLLKQMGYIPGSALGKEDSGRSELVAVEIRRSRAGIGKKDPKVEKMRREKENEVIMKIKEEMIEDFGSRQKERWRRKKVVVNFRKAEAALSQLEKRYVIGVLKKGEEDRKRKTERRKKK